MIDLNDLRHAMSRALDLGRYTVRIAVVNGEQVPSSIDLDLLERDDDDFYDLPTLEEMKRRGVRAEYMVREFDRRAMEAALRPTITPEGEALKDTVTDDHGAAVPAQDKVYASPYDPQPRIYEFALQDLNAAAALSGAGPFTLETPDILTQFGAWMGHGEDDAADWVHVYDRITRERRTLKRPETDAVLTGLRDVAADLRQKPDPMPPVGPLTSTEGLKAGDVLGWNTATGLVRAGHGEKLIDRQYVAVTFLDEKKTLGLAPPSDLRFVARPGVWMPWEGGENPVPGMRVRVRYDDHPESRPHPSEAIIWKRPWASHNPGLNVAAYMVVDTPSASSDT